MTNTREYILLAVTSLLLVSILLYLFSTGGLMTGLTAGTFELEDTFLVNSFFEENEVLNFEQQSVTSFTVLGNYKGYGEASIYLNTSEGLILVYQVENSPDSVEAKGTFVNDDFPSVILLEADFNDSESDQESVDESELNESFEETELNDSINESLDEPEVNDSLPVNDSSDDTVVNETLNDTLVNETIVEDINETINESLNETEEEIVESEISINNECVNTCSLSNVEVYNIIIEVNGGVLEINSFKYTSETTTITNIVQTQQFEDQQIILNETLTYNLSEYFTGDIDSFDVRNSNGYNYTLQDNVLSLKAIETGTWRSRIYAIGEEVVEGNDFIIEILTEPLEDSFNETTENITGINESIDLNQTINESLNETLNDTLVNETIVEDINETINESLNETEEIISAAVNETNFESRQENLPTSDLQGIIEQGQSVTVLKNYHKVETPERYEVVTYNHVTSRSPFYKVIIGVPGDELGWSENDDLTLNGQVIRNTLGEPYSLTDRQKNVMHLYVRGYGTIPEDTYLILTNNPSRPGGSADYGLMNIDNFEGKVIW